MSEKTNDSREKVRRLCRTLYYAAKRSPKRRFHALYDKLCRSDVLERAWNSVRINHGACGIDGQTLEWIEEECGVENFLRKLREDLEEGKYRPRPVKRVEIPKAKGGTRPLGIPTVRDRVVQAACRIVMEPIFEADFLDCSYGFRVRKSAHQAHFAITEASHRKGQNWVLDGDIEKYFDSIEHWKLVALLRLRISDRKVLRLIRCWLKSGMMKDGRVKPTVEGTPQGGVISPLLANVYLHFLDREWQKKYAHLGTFLRYADDFVILFRTSTHAEKGLEIVRATLKRLGLRLHPEKTRLVNLYWGKEGMDFLGFHYRRHPSSPKKVKRRLVTWPSKDAMKRIRQKVKDLTNVRRSSSLTLEEVVENLNPVLRGWVNYFRVAANSNRKFGALDWYVMQRLNKLRCKKHHAGRRWAFRDYQRLGVYRALGKVDWDLILKAAGRKVVGKPYDRKGHVRFDEGALETESRLG